MWRTGVSRRIAPEPISTPLRSTTTRDSCPLMTIDSGPAGARSGCQRYSASGAPALGDALSIPGAATATGISAASVITTVMPSAEMPYSNLAKASGSRMQPCDAG